MLSCVMRFSWNSPNFSWFKFKFEYSSNKHEWNDKRIVFTLISVGHILASVFQCCLLEMTRYQTVCVVLRICNENFMLNNLVACREKATTTTATTRCHNRCCCCRRHRQHRSLSCQARAKVKWAQLKINISHRIFKWVRRCKHAVYAKQSIVFSFFVFPNRNYSKLLLALLRLTNSEFDALEQQNKRPTSGRNERRTSEKNI